MAKTNLHKYIVAAVIVLSVMVTPVAVAQIGKSYSAGQSGLVQGMAVSLIVGTNNESRPTVEALTPSNKQQFVGIITSKEANVITVLNSGDDVFVTTRGTVNALVSNLNGAVRKGDPLAASAIKGVLTKAVQPDSAVIGYAGTDFDELKASTQTVYLDDGSTREVKVGYTNVEVMPVASPENQPGAFLSIVGESITGKPVSHIQVLAALALLFIILTIEGSIIYGAVNSSIQAVGRNPLARRSIYRHTFQAAITAVLVLLLGFTGIYLILWA